MNWSSMTDFEPLPRAIGTRRPPIVMIDVFREQKRESPLEPGVSELKRVFKPN
jgi:hypothetical protein